MFKPVTLPSDSTSTSFPSTTFNRPHSLSPPSLAYPHRRPSSVTCRSAVQDRPQTTTNSKRLYDVLRVDRNASRMEIKTAYRSLAKMYHPDTRTLPADDMSDGQYFIEIRNAYETLSDPAARAAYDLRLGVGGSRRGERLAYSMDDLASLRYDGSRRPGYCPTRRWESDQCW